MAQGDGQVKVSFGELSNAGSSIGSNAQQLDQLLDDLKGRVQTALAPWDGAAKEAYMEAQQRWDVAAADIQQIMASVSTAVNQATEAYQQAEQRNLSRW